MSRYASTTKVSPEQTRMEIERLLERYGADQFGYARDDERGVAMVTFRIADAHDPDWRRMVRLIVWLPDREDFYETASGQWRHDETKVTAAWRQEIRRRWRVLKQRIMVKLEAVVNDSGRVDHRAFDEEFLAAIVLPDGSTVGENVLPKVERAYLDGATPRLLLTYQSEQEDGHA